MEQFPKKIESKESSTFETKILSRDDLVDYIYKGQSLPQDTRFLDVEKGGVFKYFHLEDIVGINSYSKEQKLFPLVETEGVIAGLAELEQDPNDSNNFWIKFVSIDPKFQGKGYASTLISKIFDFAKENNYSLEPSFYSEEGENKLKEVMEKTERETGVKVVRKYQ
ncbi:MAG: GNAT family N-acetyltransferase [bacterium]